MLSRLCYTFIMSFESMGQKKMPTSEAVAAIMALRAQTEVMGANDYEGSAFTRLQKRLEDGEITPQEALREAQGILESKQDYH